jgi:hypothetical protein
MLEISLESSWAVGTISPLPVSWSSRMVEGRCRSSHLHDAMPSWVSQDQLAEAGRVAGCGDLRLTCSLFDIDFSMLLASPTPAATVESWNDLWLRRHPWFVGETAAEAVSTRRGAAGMMKASDR